MILEGQESSLSLGVGVFIDGFADRVPRKCYPFTLENICMLNVNLSIFNHNDLYENFKDENKTLAMASVFQEAFRTETNEETMALLHNINSDNFAEIISDIKRVSGISDINGEIDFEKTFKDNKEKMNWDIAVNSIPIYSSTPITQVKDMTLTQFNETLRLIGKKINWQYKVDTLQLTKEPNKYIAEKEHPLFNDAIDKTKKHMTMEDIAGLMGGE